MKYILVDIDHTLSAASWRDNLIPTDNTKLDNWDEYHKSSEADELINDVAQIVKTLSDGGWEIIAMTARPEKWRDLTHDWLNRQQPHLPLINELIMRPDDRCGYPTPEMKVELFEMRFPAPRNDTIIVIDDRADVAEDFRNIGLTVLQVHARIEI